jgi:DNA replication protein DnaC
VIDRAQPGVPVPCPACNPLAYVRAAHLPYLTVGEDNVLTWEGELDLANFADPTIIERVSDWQAHVVENVREGRGLLLYSRRTGSGKTRLAAECGLHAALAGHRVTFKNLGRLLDEMRATFDKGQGTETVDAIMHRMVTADLLILDDLGAHNPTKFAQEKLFAILDERLYQRRAMVITTNYDPETLGPAVSPENPIMGERIASRLADLCSFIEVRAKRDYRLVRAARR